MPTRSMSRQVDQILLSIRKICKRVIFNFLFVVQPKLIEMFLFSFVCEERYTRFENILVAIASDIFE